MATEILKSCCNMCYRLCGVLVTVADGVVTRVEGNPACPVNKGSLCAKGLTAIERLNHPDRLLHPLKRVGKRGEGKWQRVSWDEALDKIAEAMNKTKTDYGAESVAFSMGDPKGFELYQWRLATVFGTPNVCDTRHVCSVPRRMGQNVTCGFNEEAGTDYTSDIDFSECVVLWAVNVEFSHMPNAMQLDEAMSKGAKLIVVDPRRTNLAARADMWIQLRPKTDLALALAMINVIINENLYDKEFVEKYTVGFEELKLHVQAWTPEKVADISWVPAEQIKQLARMYATIKPACIRGGNAIDDDINSVSVQRALTILAAITGNLGVIGGEANFVKMPLDIPQILGKPLDRERKMMRLGIEHGFVPHGAANIVIPQLLVKAILEHDPYPVRVLCIHANNPLVTWSNTKKAYEALMALDFFYVADQFMTPSAEIADIVLPAATYLEYDDIAVRSPYIVARQKATQIGEVWPDKKIYNELAKKLGLGEHFWGDINEALDVFLKPMGKTFDEFRKMGWHVSDREYKVYEKEGFKTPSGKVELYSSLLKKWGKDPLPVYYEVPETPVSAPELLKEYPLIFTSWHPMFYHHSDNRQIASLRAQDPVPVIELHPKTAAPLGIKDGDKVYVETKRGRAKLVAKLTEGIDPRVVAAEIDWWFPEQGRDTLYGYQESNVNMITDDQPPFNPELGSSNLRGFLCKVYKAS